MKRRLPWVLVALVLVSAVAIMLWPSKPVVRPQVELSFLHFTNGPRYSLAIFAVHFPRNFEGITWKETELDHWESGRWNPLHLPGRGSDLLPFQGGGPRGTVAPNGKRIDRVAEFFIPDTNDSWRIRTPVEEDRPWSGMERLPFLGRKLRQVHDDVGDPPRTFNYWVTNVVGPAGSRP